MIETIDVYYIYNVQSISIAMKYMYLLMSGMQYFPLSS